MVSSLFWFIKGTSIFCCVLVEYPNLLSLMFSTTFILNKTMNKTTTTTKTTNWFQQWIRQQQQEDKLSFWIWQWIRQQQQQNDKLIPTKNEMLILGLCCHLSNSLLKTMLY